MIQQTYLMHLIYKHKSGKEIKEGKGWHEIFARQAKIQVVDIFLICMGVGFYASFVFAGAPFSLGILADQILHFHALVLCITFRNLRLIVDKRKKRVPAKNQEKRTKFWQTNQAPQNTAITEMNGSTVRTTEDTDPAFVARTDMDIVVDMNDKLPSASAGRSLDYLKASTEQLQ
jgi:hypothetical protein